jgi:hypothetical protein
VRPLRRHGAVDAVFAAPPRSALARIGDVLEELTTTWYFGAAMIVLWLLSRVLQNNLLLALAGLAILAGPAVVPAGKRKRIPSKSFKVYAA